MLKTPDKESVFKSDARFAISEKVLKFWVSMIFTQRDTISKRCEHQYPSGRDW